MRLGLLSYGFASWGGGVDFVRYLAAAIVAADRPQAAEKALILPAPDLRSTARKYLGPLRAMLGNVRRGELPRFVAPVDFPEGKVGAAFADFFEAYQPVYSGSNYGSQLAAARRIAADVVLPCIAPPAAGFTLPWVGYLYDFQHKHLPGFFSPQEIALRDRQFADMLAKARHVIVNARSVAQDIRTFHPQARAQVHVLPFAPCPQQAWLDSTLDVREQYGIGQPYFMVSNQFWKHKDHATTFRALAHYAQAGGEAILVCTGQTGDHRFPGYFDELTALIARSGVAARIRILGHIPKVDQVALMKHALAVIQPTLFEGGPGGGASYDAISLGRPVIASDIPVNLEMDCGDVSYFKAGDALSLSTAMLAHGSEARASPASAILWQQGLARRSRCGEFILNVAQQAIKDHQNLKRTT